MNHHLFLIKTVFSLQGVIWRGQDKFSRVFYDDFGYNLEVTKENIVEREVIRRFFLTKL